MAVPTSIRLIDQLRRRASGGIAAMSLEDIQQARTGRIPDVPLVGGLLRRGAEKVLGTLADGVVVEEVTVPGAVGDLPARVLRPPVVGPAAPLVLHLHGGGWVVGGPALYDWYCGQLALGLGATVVSVDYRKAPEHPAPAAAEDAVAVARWLLADGGRATLGAPGPMVVTGDSAGGNLSALVALAVRDEGLPGLAAQLLVYPATDLTMTSRSANELTHEPILTRVDMEAFLGHYLADGSDPADPSISPLHAEDVAGLAPACIITAERDPLVDEGRAYAQRLADAGVPVRHTTYVDMPHGFVSLPGLTPMARQAVAEMVAFAQPLLDDRAADGPAEP